MSYMLSHYRLACDPYHRGYTSAELITLGYLVTRGLVFPWTGGGHLLVRRRLYPTTGKWRYCGFARPSESTIKNMKSVGHDPEQAYQYTVVKVLGNGFVSKMAEPIRVDFDSEGARITPALPMFPLSAVAKPLAGGKFRLSWEYSSYGQGGWPKDFQVFRGATAETVDYETPLVDSLTGLAYVLFNALTRYTFTTGAYDDGTACVFGVRSRNTNGVAELNTYTTKSKVAKATGPAAAGPVGLSMRRA